jgi:hypothetical protein
MREMVLCTAVVGYAMVPDCYSYSRPAPVSARRGALSVSATVEAFVCACVWSYERTDACLRMFIGVCVFMCVYVLFLLLSNIVYSNVSHSSSVQSEGLYSMLYFNTAGMSPGTRALPKFVICSVGFRP